MFLQFTMELVTSSIPTEQAYAQELHDDWCRARGRLITEMTAKLSYFQQLPWKLLQLAHHDPLEATAGAQACLHLFTLGGPGTFHRQSQRFLNPAYSGHTGDPPLRQYVERVARGEDASQINCAEFQQWIARLACLKLAERSTEGVHAVLTRVGKRAPSATVGYMSIELRFAWFWKQIAQEPAALGRH